MKRRRQIVQRITLWGMLSNTGLAALKFIFGFLAASQALIADAVHSLTDTVTDIAVIVGAKFWSAPADIDHPHGHGRIETMVAVLIGIILAAIGVGLGYRALSTLSAAPEKTPGWAALAVACISIAVKEILYRWNVDTGKKIKSSALIANAWHHRSDAMSSVPVAIAVLGTKIKPEWTFLDHVGAIIVSVFILQAAWKIIWPALNQLADAGVSLEERERLRSIAIAFEAVKDVHAIRTRNIGAGFQVDMHLMVDPALSVSKGHEIAGMVKEKLLCEGQNVVDVLIHIEPFQPREK